MSFPRYPKYKDSGVEWLGLVPEHWDVKPVASIATIINGYPFDSERFDPAVGYPLIRIRDLDCNETEAYYNGDMVERAAVTLADMLVGMDGDFNVGRWRGAGVALLNQRMCCIRGNAPLITRLLEYGLPTPLSQINAVTYSTTVKHLSSSQVEKIRVAIPPIDTEQRGILAFLDRETVKIDALIAEQQRLIELLQEKRQAVISHAVTKGLNPDVPMKDSGIEWLGEVPEHWEVGRIKNYFKTCSGGTPNTTQHSLYYAEQGEGHPWVRTTDLNNDLVTCVPVYITDQALHDTACEILPSGTVMVGMYGGSGTVGKNGLLMLPAAINQAVCGLLPNENHDFGYTFRFMQFYRPYWMIGAESSRKDPNISQEQVKNAPVLCPPVKEQRHISSFLDSRTRSFDRLIGEAERAIALLQERRSALISAAVTGQIDVRGIAGSEAA